jgi:hypothetical protein
MIAVILVNFYALFYAVLGGILILRAFGLWRGEHRQQ